MSHWLFTLHQAHKKEAKISNFNAYQMERYNTYIEQLENISEWVKSNPNEIAEVCMSLYLTDHTPQEVAIILDKMED